MSKLTKKKWVMILIASLLLVIICGGIVWWIVVKDKSDDEPFDITKTSYYQNKLSTYISENASYEDGEVDVVFLGDSLTDMCDIAKYYPEYIALNRGIGGDTTIALESRLKVSVYDVKPKVLVMLIGVNNINTMLDNYENILKGFKENIPDTKVVLLSLTAMGGNWGKKNQTACYNNVFIEKYAEKYGYNFVDLYTPLFDTTIGEVYDGYTTDGGHFSDQGYVVVSNTIKPTINKLLNK